MRIKIIKITGGSLERYFLTVRRYIQAILYEYLLIVVSDVFPQIIETVREVVVEPNRSVARVQVQVVLLE